MGEAEPMPEINLERRQFFGVLAAGAAGLRALGCQTVQGQVPAAAVSPADEWARVRAEFSLSPKYIHLAGVLLASHPRPVREAIERHRRALRHQRCAARARAVEPPGLRAMAG
jgi:hypothetical protein